MLKITDADSRYLCACADITPLAYKIETDAAAKQLILYIDSDYGGLR